MTTDTQRAAVAWHVGAGVPQAHEQAGAGDAGDAGAKTRADLRGHMGGDQPIHGFAFGRHRATLGAGNALGDLGEFASERELVDHLRAVADRAPTDKRWLAELAEAPR